MSNTNTYIFVNGKIFTADDSNLYGDSMIVKDGTIQWVGWEADRPSCEGTVVDLGQKRVIPGFVDSHMHCDAGRFSKKNHCHAAKDQFHRRSGPGGQRLQRSTGPRQMD